MDRHASPIDTAVHAPGKERVMNQYTEALAVGIVTAIVACVAGIGAVRADSRTSVAVATPTGLSEAGTGIEVRSRISGRVASINFAKGQQVSKGQVLLVIDPQQYEVALNKARARLAKAQWQYEFAARERAANQRASHGVSHEELDSSMAAADRASAAIQADKAALQEAQENLKETQVTAPISGTVSSPEVTIGYLVESGQTRLATLEPGTALSMARD